MSSELEREFKIFSKQVWVMSRQWAIICLFKDAGNEGLELDKAECLGKGYPALYDMFFRATLDSIIISLARFGDPAIDNKGNKNLSIQRIWMESKHEELGMNVRSAENAKNKAIEELKSSEFQKYRNKLIVHNDLKTLKDNTYEGITYEKVRKAVHWVKLFHMRMIDLCELTKQIDKKSTYWEQESKMNKFREEMMKIASLTMQA